MYCDHTEHQIYLLLSQFMKRISQELFNTVNLPVCKVESMTTGYNILTRVLSVYLPLFYLLLKNSLRSYEEGREISKTTFFLQHSFYLMDWFSLQIHRVMQVYFYTSSHQNFFIIFLFRKRLLYMSNSPSCQNPLALPVQFCTLHWLVGISWWSECLLSSWKSDKILFYLFCKAC